MPENSSVHGRLDSWKEIADYLKRDIRTAIRWGKDRGMPVHRVPGGKRQAVFAFKDEIDAWLVSRSNDHLVPPIEEATDVPDPATSDATAGSPPEAVRQFEEPAPEALAGRDFSDGKPAGFNKLKLAAAGAASLLLLFAAARFFLTRSAAKASVGPLRFARVTDDGRAKGNLRTDGATLYFNELEVSREILVSMPAAGGPTVEISTPLANVDLQDISNDGRRLLVTSFEGTEAERPLWIIPAQGGNADPVPDVLCRFARWSPDNRRIACAAGSTITLLKPDGSDRTPLGPFPGIVVNPLWSPDGERLRFLVQDQRTITSTAWEISGKAGGSVQSAVQLPWGRACSGDWAWIHGGESFVYKRLNGSGNPALYLRPGRDTSSNVDQEVELPISIGDIEAISPAQNGSILYLLTPQGRGGQLLKFDKKQKGLQEILPGLSADLLSFSRDGQWMTYTTSTDHSLWRSRVDGSDALRLTSPPMDVEFSAWSPDGQWIAFMGKQPGKPWRILLIRRDGGQAREAAAGDDQQGAPTWSPDGKFLAYGNVSCREIQACWIRVLNLSTRQTEKLPGSLGFRTARWSPDGKYIAAFHPETHQVMVFDIRKRRWSLLADSVTGDNLNWSSDSKFVYADSPQGKNPAIERFRIADGQRATVMSLAPLENVPGHIDFWFGLTPANELVLYQLYDASEVYALNWTDH